MKVRTVNLRWNDINMSELDLHKLILHYEQSNKAEGKSPATVTWYSEMLGGFVKFLEFTGRGPILSGLNVLTVREFIIHEQARLVSDYTVQGKVRTLKAFSSWLMREGYTSDNVLANVRLTKVTEKLIEPITNDEIEKLISAQNPLTAIGSRNIAILTAFLETGMRESELSYLRYADAHIEEGYLKVMGKGSKERILPIGGLTQKILWRYVFHFRPEPENDLNDYLFLTLDGKKLQPNALKLLLNRWGKRAGVPRLHCHLCRHTFATNFLIYKCGDVFRLQQILGHNTLEMVRRYVHYASTQAMIQGHVSSPMDRMGIKGLRGYKIDRILKNGRG
jgi:site-specific recombinase XerD